MRSVLLAAASAAFLAGCGIGGPEYPQFGHTAYRMEGLTRPASGSAATRTVIFRDGPKMRVEAVLPTLGAAIIVFEDATDAAYVLDPVRQPAAAATPSPSTPKIAPTAGVALRIDDADAPQPLEMAWEALGADNARSAGPCEVAGERGHQWRPREEIAGVERIACITADGIVLRVSENGHALWQTTSLQRGAQDSALFGVPAGYRLIDLRRMAEQVGANLDTGAPEAQREAPPPRS